MAPKLQQSFYLRGPWRAPPLVGHEKETNMTSAPREETLAPEGHVGLAPAVLVVMSAPERLIPLLSKLEVDDLFTVHATDSFHGACRQLRADPDVVVIITDITLPDANWCDILRFLVANDLSASVVVTAPDANESFWSEVLWRGGYDLLLEPYEDLEIKRIVKGAARAAREEFRFRPKNRTAGCGQGC